MAKVHIHLHIKFNLVIKLNKRYELIPQVLRKLIQSYYTGSKAPQYFFFLFSTIYFICIQIFNNCRRKFPKIPMDSAKKGATRCRNERAKPNIMNDRSKKSNIFNNFFLDTVYLQALKTSNLIKFDMYHIVLSLTIMIRFSIL